MIISDKIKIKISRKTITYFNKLGYDIKIDDIIYVNPIELPKGSHIKIKVRCDMCGKEKEIMYQKYIKNINNGGIYTCSSKCAQFKVNQTSLEKFGAMYYTQTDEYKKRYKSTVLDKYGVEHHTKLKIVKDKAKQTNIEKYGVDNPSKSDEIKDKIKKTFIEKYGVENISHLDSVKKDISQKINERISEIRKKAIKTLEIRYGVDNPSKLDFVKRKIKEKSLKKYGVSTPLLLKENRDKLFKSKILNWKNNKISNDNNIVNIDIKNKKIIFKCDKNHITSINYKTYYNRNLSNTIICTECNPTYPNTSGMELSLLNFIEENYYEEIITNSKNIINPYELDIYLPNLNLAFEFNGVYWHNELNKDKNYHITKSNICDEKNIQLIHIYEDDWIYKKDIIKSMILNKLGKTPNKIYARKTEVKEITDNKLVRKFLIENHIQGFVGSKIKIGLFYNNKLVSLMTFGMKRKSMNSSSNNNEYELLRFCNKLNTNVVGGASKLFKYFISNYEFNDIITYADRGYSNGNLYKKLGFKFMHKTTPNYFYVIDGIRHHRFNYRKDKLIKDGFDPNKTEHEIMLERKIYRIYNSGNLKFILTIK